MNDNTKSAIAWRKEAGDLLPENDQTANNLLKLCDDIVGRIRKGENTPLIQNAINRTSKLIDIYLMQIATDKIEDVKP